MTTMTEPPVEQEPSARPAAERSKLQSLLQFEITPRKIPRKELMHFSRQLAVFIKAGIPIIEALDTIRSEVTHKLFAQVLDEMVTSLQSGSTFATSVPNREAAFPPYYLGIIRSAETTGQLDKALDQLANYIERDLEARRKVISALTYPAIVAAMSLVVVIVLVAFVLPRFRHFFNDLNAKLPLPTRMLLAVTDFTQNYWYLFAALGGLLVALGLWLTQTDRGRRVRDRAVLRVPVLGDLVQSAVLERTCRILASMTHAGVPLPEAMRVTIQATTNAVYRDGLEVAREAMMRGEGLATPLARTGLFPAAARQMIRVGENTGSLDEQLDTAASYYDREMDYKIKRFTSLFEPLVIVFVGLIVGFVAVALISAMYGIFHQVKVG
jgi:type IV pilus assembly protein PilC